MLRVYSSDNTMLAGHVRALLQQAGIDCFLRNDNLWGGIGELAPIDCWPEVWIRDDGDYERAAEIVRDVLDGRQTDGPSWRCTCGEEIEGQFSACWKCGSEKTGSR